MFRATILPIIRSIRLYKAACGMNHPSELPAGGLVTEEQISSVTRPPADNSLGWLIPQAALYSLGLLMMGKIVARNMSS